MARFALVAPPLRGHLDPLFALAGSLVARGHEVIYFGPGEADGMARAAGVKFVASGATIDGGGERRARIMADAASMLGMFQVIRLMARDTGELLTALPGAFDRASIDAVISDQLEPGGALVALATKRRYVTIASALPINRDPDVPPFFTGWLPDPSPKGRRMIAGAEAVYDIMLRPQRRLVARAAGKWGLGRRAGAHEFLSPFADLAQIPAAFDFPRPGGGEPAYVGPIRLPRQTPDGEELPPAVQEAIARGRGLVLCSFGTLLGGAARALEAVAEGCRRHDFALVITHGGRLGADAVERLSKSAVVVPFVDQRAVLAHARLCVTHGGMNTMMDALAARVPVLAAPLAFDQQAIAARLVFHGAGRRIAMGRLSGDRVAEALGALAVDGAYAEAAARMAAAIGEAGGREAAADIVERACLGGTHGASLRPLVAAPSGGGGR